MNKQQAIEIAISFLKQNNQLVKSCDATWRLSDERVRASGFKSEEIWVARFVREGQSESEVVCPGFIIVLIDGKTGNSWFGDAL